MLTLLLASMCTLTVLLVLGQADASNSNNNSNNSNNSSNNSSRGLKSLPQFYSHDVLGDGETERALYWNGVAVKETSAVLNFNGTKEGATLRQVTKGSHLIQLIYDAGGSLTDCEFVSDEESVGSFIETFSSDYHMQSKSSADVRMKSIRRIDDAGDVPADMAAFADYAALKSQCRRLHKRIRHNVARQSGQGLAARRDKRDVMMLVGTKWCGAGNRAASYNDLGADHGIDRCCRHHDHCPYTIKSQDTGYEHTNELFITVSHCTCDERRGKRDAFTSKDELLMIPNTNWCGRGNRADRVSDLGGAAAADRCCRQHDMHCPLFISGWDTKYGLYNQRPYTAMHCTCDDRFRSCLKQANTAAANLVGKLFFNIIQTKCFVLKPEKVCKKTSWWGKCLKTELKKKAYIRDPIPY